jgi:hypothetical protein
MDARSNYAVREGKPYNLLSGLWCSPKKSGLLIPYEENLFNSGEGKSNGP